ncbi:MAG: hypothetical protein Q9170_007070 [Blastenia crenularia]
MDQPIRIWYDKCYQAFGALLRASSVNTRCSEQVPHDVLVDLLGRFNIWAGNIGAGQQGRASLDYRLREAAYIKDAVVRTLQYLFEALQDITSIVSGLRLPYDELSSDSESSESSSFDDHGGKRDGSSRIDIELAQQEPLRTELQQLQHAISSFLRNLYQTSIIVRSNPVPHDRLAKSAKIDTSFYEEFDERHVREKFPHADPDLIRRLGKAISKRRKYFKYREQHRQKLSIAQDHRDRGPIPNLSHAPVSESPADSHVPDTPRDPVAEEGKSSVRQPTNTKESTTASTFIPPPTPLPLNLELIDYQSDAGTQTTYESVLSMVPGRLRIPDPPKASQNAAEFECPYCYTILLLRSRHAFKRRIEWKQHVLRDLQPYVCTFGGCSQANTLYERRGEWMRHEVQYHRKEWSCNVTGHEIYTSRGDFKAHMNHQHGNSFNVDQSEMIVDMLERPATQSGFSCPLRCNEDFVSLDLDRFERHLGRHLEILARFALPSTGSESRASNDSVAAQDERHNDDRSSQSDRTADEDAISFDNDDEGYLEMSEMSNKKNRSLSGQLESYLQKFWRPQQTVTPIVVKEEFAIHCLCSWARIYLESIWENTLCDADIHAIVVHRSVPTGSGSAVLSMGELYDRAFLCATRMLKVEESLSHGDDRLPILLRSRLKDFTDTMISEISPENEQFDLLLQQLQLLQAKLRRLPWSFFSTDFEQERGFSDTGEPHTEKLIGPSEQDDWNLVEDFCKWLAPVTQSPLFLNDLSQIHPNTGAWFTGSSKYEKFISQSLRVLLVVGLPGCGKTRLFAKAVQEIKRVNDAETAFGLAYYFLGEAVDSIAAVFRNLICQLVRQAKSIPPTTESIVKLQASSSSSASLSIDQLEVILEGAVSLFKRTVIAVDALDKIEKSSVLILSRFIRRVSNQGVQIRLIATSRTSLSVDDAFWDPTFGERSGEERSRWMSSRETFFIDPLKTAQDIRIYADAAINGNAVLRDASAQVKERLISEIVDESGGMFIIAALTCDRIHECVSKDEIMYAASTTPEGINNIWQEALVRIVQQSQSGDVRVAQQVLEMLSVCERNLTVQEIHGNLRCASIHMSDKLDVWRQYPTLCELAIFPKQSGNEEFGLIHESIGVFLRSNQIRDGPLRALAVDKFQAQRNITSRCLTELFEYRSPDSYTSKFGWTAYAGTYWHVHAKRMFHEKPSSRRIAAVWGQCTQLLRSETASFAHWTYMTRGRGHIDKDEQGDFGQKESYPSPIYYAALLGLLPCAEELIEEGEDINVKGGKHRYPILAAVAMEEIGLMRLLLDNGANVNSQYANGDTALIRAAQRGHEDMFEALLAAHANVDVRDKKRGMTAAHWAVLHDRPQFLEMLLSANADRSPRDGMGRTPLHWAVQYDNVANTKLLLKAGADLEAPDNDGRRPLHIAAEGSPYTLSVLLRHGAAVNAMTNRKRTPLFIVAGGVSITIVQQLLDNGADVNVRDVDSQLLPHILHRAAAPLPDMKNTPGGISTEEVYAIKREIVKLLLDHGAPQVWLVKDNTLPEDVAEDPEITAILQTSRKACRPPPEKAREKGGDEGVVEDVQASEPDYQKDDTVYIHNGRRSLGPFIIDKVLDDGRYQLRKSYGDPMEKIYEAADLSREIGV